MTKPTYRDPRWKAVRLAVLRRDAYTCQIKRPKCRTLATEVDHIRAVSDGGAPFDAANLRAACKGCNVGARNVRVAALAKQARTGTQEAPSAPVASTYPLPCPTPGEPGYVPSVYDW